MSKIYNEDDQALEKTIKKKLKKKKSWILSHKKIGKSRPTPKPKSNTSDELKAKISNWHTFTLRKKVIGTWYIDDI